MREILFRGKRIDNGEWVEGFYVMYSKSIAYPYSYTNGEHTIVTLPHNFKYEIEFETICQYTGFNDKKRKEIFENDILKISNEVDNGILAVVKFGEYNSPFCSDNFGGHLGFYLDFQEKNDVLRKDFLYWCKNEYIEVVGDIFDNKLEDFEK